MASTTEPTTSINRRPRNSGIFKTDQPITATAAHAGTTWLRRSASPSRNVPTREPTANSKKYQTTEAPFRLSSRILPYSAPVSPRAAIASWNRSPLVIAK